MRRPLLDLTMNAYTDPELIDMAGAMEALPELGLQRDALPDARVDAERPAR